MQFELPHIFIRSRFSPCVWCVAMSFMIAVVDIPLRLSVESGVLLSRAYNQSSERRATNNNDYQQQHVMNESKLALHFTPYASNVQKRL